MSDTVTVTIDDALTPGGAAVKVEPELSILENAAKMHAVPGAQPMTPAQVYGLGVLNALKAFSKDPRSVALPKFQEPKSGLVSVNQPVHKVTIKLHSRRDGGVTAEVTPKFSTLLAMVAGRSNITEVHKYGLVACGRLYQMAKGKA